MRDRHLALIAHNLRSCYNVGSLLRTADGLGVKRVFLTGYTPYPIRNGDTRLPHIADNVHKQIQKTALGAEELIKWSHFATIEPAIKALRNENYTVLALEQTTHSIMLSDFVLQDRIAFIVGREVEGLEPEVIKLADDSVTIPMFGKKESFNVVQAAAMALYHCRFFL